MFKGHLLKEVLEILDLNDFRSVVFRGCFDILTKKDDTLLIKVLGNIDSFSEEHANNLKIISNFLDAKSFAVSVRSNRNTLSDNVIYSRFGLPIMSLGSFNNIISNEWLPSIFAVRGKHVVRVDPDLIKKSRESMDLSLDELSEKVGISKKSLYEIENQRVDPSKETLDKLEGFFGIEFSRGCEIKVPNSFHRVEPKSDFQKRVYSKFSEIRMECSCLSSSPFEVVGRRKEVFLTSLSENEKEVNIKSRVLNNMSPLTDGVSVLISKGSGCQSVEGVPIIHDSEIDEIGNYKDFSCLVKERRFG
ncbi:MAG: helix-turn-helix domain-containing protein [Candidatus Aenigmarchaeota archaeon]|nr:helix-turn-helix domain-containing protein [Candidatus Aenigmarchaeota archaeon]